MKKGAAWCVASALLFATAGAAGAQKKGSPTPLSADAVNQFLGSWYSVPYDCGDCSPEGLPMTEVATVIVSQDSKGLSVALRDESWAGRMGLNGYPEVGHSSSHSMTTDLTLVGDGLRCLIKGKGEVVLRRITADTLQVEVHQLDKKTIGGAGSSGTSTYTNDPAPIKEAIARHPGGGGAFGLLSEVLGGLAQMPVPQTRIPPQPAPSSQPQSTQSRYPGAQPAGGAPTQQQQAGAGAGAAAPSGTPASPACVSVQRAPGASGDVWGLANRCNYDVEVRFCVQNQKSSLGCQETTQGGETGIKANGFEYALPFYADEGRGEVIFAACIAPAVPANWEPVANGLYSCR